MNKGTEKKKENHVPSSNTTITIRREPWIGGPGSRLPFVVESFLGWGLAISCLSVACYHYVRQMVTSSTLGSLLLLPFSSASTSTSDTQTNKTATKSRISNGPILPLTTHSRREILSKSTLERYQQLYQYLLKLDPTKNTIQDWLSHDQDKLVTLIRSNLVLRRLVSLFMVKQQQDPLSNYDGDDDNDGQQQFGMMIQLLNSLWPRLVQLPLSLLDDANSSKKYDYDISIIVPAYRENGKLLFHKLQEVHDLITLKKFKKTCKMEVVVVHAHCTEMEEFVETKTNSKMLPHFSKMTLAPDVGGGRGPCLNHGADISKGRILTFLHADTRLSVGWNEAILQAFSSGNDNDNDEKKLVNSCAFSFAIDTSSVTTTDNSKQQQEQQYFPPGIRAVETTANLRSHWFHLPYGDQCLSVPSFVFDYVGGYPHQCLMEDYELVRLLRQRVAMLGEELTILDKHQAKCHVRRWQKFGVLYVTLTNSKLVNLYSRHDMTAEELFAIYYGMDPEGKDDPIPWEVELEEFIKK